MKPLTAFFTSGATAGIIQTLGSALLLTAMLLAGCGDNNPGDITAPVTTASPDGGLTRGEIKLTANEPATIYYTVDGSTPTTASASGPSPVAVSIDEAATVKFFAVDDNDNAEAVQSIDFGYHRFGPKPLVVLRAAADEDDAGTVNLSWEAPDGASEVIIVRGATSIAQFPANGATLALGNPYLGGEVIYAGSGTTASESGLAPGGYVYTGFVKYASGIYSEARFASAGVDGSHALGNISFDLTTDAATITQPGSATVAITNIVHDEGNGTLTFDIALTSTVASTVFAPKLVFGALPQGALQGAGDPTSTVTTMTEISDFHEQRVLLYGPQALPSGAPRTRTVTITGLGGATSPFAFDVAFDWGRAVYTSPWCTYDGDGAVGITDPKVEGGVKGFSDISGYDNPNRDPDCRALRGTMLSADGRYLYAGARNGSRIGKWDTATGQEVAGLDLAVTRTTGAASDMALDPSGRRIWVVLNDGMHTGAWRGSVQNYLDNMDGRTETENHIDLVEVDVATMTETGRVRLASGDIQLRGRRLAVSRDGHQIAVAIGHPYGSMVSEGKIALVDAGSLAIIDAGDETAGADLIDLPDDIRSSQCGFSWSGDKLVCNNSWQEQCDLLAVIDLGAASLEVEAIDTDGTADCDVKAMQFVATSDNKMWLIGEYDALRRLAADNTVETIGSTSYNGTSAFIADESPDKLIVMDYQSLQVIDTTTGEVNFYVNGGSSSYGHTTSVSPY